MFKLVRLAAFSFFLTNFAVVGRFQMMVPQLQRFVDTLEHYSAQENNIVFLLDTPDGIGEDIVSAQLVFCDVVSQLFLVSPRFAIFTSSSDGLRRQIDQISEGSGNKCDFVHQLYNIPASLMTLGNKYSASLLSELLLQGRPGVNRIIILVESGQPGYRSRAPINATELKAQGVIIFALGVNGANNLQLQALSSSQNHTFMMPDLDYLPLVNNDLHRDVRTAKWTPVSSTHCLGSCPANAMCACGAPRGIYDCVCKPGYENSRRDGSGCQPCSRGSYKEEIGRKKCAPCPQNFTTAGEGTVSASLCTIPLRHNNQPATLQPTHKEQCAPVQPPEHGSVICSSEELVEGTKCATVCEPGYYVNGEAVLKCGTGGQWSAKIPTCEDVLKYCSNKNIPVETNQTLHVEGALNSCSCTPKEALSVGEGVQKQIAIYVPTTDAGLETKEEATANQNLDAIGTEDCRSDVTTFTQKESSFSPPLSWKEPTTVFGNGTPVVIMTSQEYLGLITYRFPIGKTKLRYKARDMELGTTSTCDFTVTVLDVTAPAVVYCPDDINVVSNTPTANVTWKEPIFTDNDPTPLKISVNTPPGSVFAWGNPGVVRYEATDGSNNTAFCSFRVIVKPHPCPYVPPPKYGYVVCDSKQAPLFCSVYCEEGYNFVFRPEPIYRCKVTKGGSVWSSFSRKPRITFPWPDCAALSENRTSTLAGSTSTGIKCKFSAEKEREMKTGFFNYMTRLSRVPGLCDPSLGCTLDNIAIFC